MNSSPSNPFSSLELDGANDNDDFDAFSLASGAGVDGGGQPSPAAAARLPSLRSIQPRGRTPTTTTRGGGGGGGGGAGGGGGPMPPPEESVVDDGGGDYWHPGAASVVDGDIDDRGGGGGGGGGEDRRDRRPQPQPSSSTSLPSRILTCGGACSIRALRPYFDVDSIDVLSRARSAFTLCAVNDGFRRRVLYSDDDDASGGLSLDENNANDDDGGESSTTPACPGGQPGRRRGGGDGKGPDLYGPVWITLTLVFTAAVTSNMSLYLHHARMDRQASSSSAIVDGGGAADAEEEWEYDIDRLVHAATVLYAYSFGLPAALHLVLRLMGGYNNDDHPSDGGAVGLDDDGDGTIGRVGRRRGDGARGGSVPGLAELVCLYGYSLVPYLPAAWACVVPYDWVRWSALAMATFVSGAFVLRNVVGAILKNDGIGIGIGGGGRRLGQGGGLIMCLVGCHLVFFLVMKLTFYHHDGVP
jgi:hypothetical protein